MSRTSGPALTFDRADYRWDDGRTERVNRLRAEQWVPQPIETVFDYFRDEKNLESLTPKFMHFRVTGKSTPDVRAGTRIDYTLRVRGVPLRWRTEIRDWKPLAEFADFQEKGPYALWHHFHRFEAVDGGTRMRDEVFFALPLGRLGELVAGAYVRSDVRKIFAYRFSEIEKRFGTPAGR